MKFEIGSAVQLVEKSAEIPFCMKVVDIDGSKIYCQRFDKKNEWKRPKQFDLSELKPCVAPPMKVYL